MRRIFLTFIFLFIAFSTVIFAQDTIMVDAPLEEATENVDLRAPYVMECVAVGGVSGGWPPAVDHVTYSGTCSSPAGCDVGVCLGDNCTVYDQEKDIRYFGKVGSGLPNVTVSGATPHRFPPGQFTDLPGSIANPADHVTYSIYAIWEQEPLGMGTDAENPSQQLGAAKLEFPRGGEDCASVYWDPYGRVFDAVSLEPLGAGEAIVTLLDEAGNYVSVPSNNTPIDKLGKYNIFLEIDGKYKLKVDGMANHDFVSVMPSSQYTQLYEKLYKAGDPAFFESKDNPQRFDIPVKPKSTPYHRDPETIFKKQNIIWNFGEEYLKIEFRVSHPRTKIMANLEDGWVCEQTKSNYTDKDGFCLILVKTNQVPVEGVNIEYVLDQKYYPTASSSPFGRLLDAVLSLFTGKVNAQQSIKINDTTAAEETPETLNISGDRFEPILRHVEGYAYDENDEPIAGAKINVRLMNKSIFYSTTADDQGFFTIYKNNLPPFEFELQFIDPKTGQEIVKTASEFVRSNESYLKTERINLMAGTKYDQPIVDPKTGKLNQIDKNYQPPQPTSEATQTTGKSAFNSGIFLIAFILLVLFASVIGVAFYIKKTRVGP